MRNFVRRFLVVGLMVVATSGIAAAAGPAQAAPAAEPVAGTVTTGDVGVAGTGVVTCGYLPGAYERCAAARQAMINEGTQVSRIWWGGTGCTAPGCIDGYFFYYYW